MQGTAHRVQQRVIGNRPGIASMLLMNRTPARNPAYINKCQRERRSAVPRILSNITITYSELSFTLVFINILQKFHRFIVQTERVLF